MRVAVVFYGLHAHGGGVFTFQRSLLATLRRLAPDLHHEFVYYSAGAPSGDPEVIEIPVSLVAAMRRRSIMVVREVQDRFGMRRAGWRTWFERSLSEHEVDFVWFAANYTEDCDVPFIFTLFDLGHRVEPHFPELSARGEWVRREHHFERGIRRASAVIVPNEAGRDQVLRYHAVEPHRILCLPHSTPELALEAESADADELLARLGVRRPYLLYPAQFWAHKNHYNLLRAVRRLADDGGIAYDLVLVGSDKGQEPHVRSLVGELGLGDRVHMPGFVEVAELVALYREAHALTYLSFLGPENLPPLEAFALGCPVINADVPGAREQLGEGALYVPPTDADAVAAAVRALEDVEVRARLLAAGRELAATYTPERYVQGVLDFLDGFEPVRRCWPAASRQLERA